jgi:serine protease Do
MQVKQHGSNEMRELTNHLVVIGKRFAAPIAVAGAFVLGAVLYAGHGNVFASSGNGVAPLDDESTAALTALDRAMEAVTSRVTPAVVNVAVTAKVQADDDEGQQRQIPPDLRKFFGGMMPQMQGPQGPQIEHGIGSGVIISSDGYIVTNAHVVDGATQVKVTLHDRRSLPAKVVGVDKLTDLAVVKVDAKDLPAIAWGDSTKLQTGQTVLAFGSPFGLSGTITRGIVSALDRPNPYRDDPRKPGAYIQTDAAINPGNSGGALVNAHGELVGINTFIISGSGQFEGAGFAIPVRMVRSVTTQLIAHGKIEHGYLGININDVTPENASFFNVSDPSGALVAQVQPDSPASKGGLKQGDVVKEVNGEKVADAGALQMSVSEMQPGSPLKLAIVRDGKPITLNLTVGSFKGNTDEAANESVSENKGRIGVSLGDMNDDARQQFQIPARVKGAVVGEVRPGSPAEDAGLQPGDVIQEVNRKPVASASEAVSQIHAAPEGRDVLLLVWSHGNASYRTVHPDAQ